MSDELKPYWLSWTSKTEAFVMYFPWWISGYECHEKEDRPTICAAVWARSQQAAKDIIKNSHFEQSDGLNIEYRFCEERPLDWSPFCDRFPRGDWMIWWDDGAEFLRSRVEELTAEVEKGNSAIRENCNLRMRIQETESRASVAEERVKELIKEGNELHKQVTVDGWTYKEWPEVVAKAKEAVK